MSRSHTICEFNMKADGRGGCMEILNVEVALEI